jgi:hypothetical protein
LPTSSSNACRQAPDDTTWSTAAGLWSPGPRCGMLRRLELADTHPRSSEQRSLARSPADLERIWRCGMALRKAFAIAPLVISVIALAAVLSVILSPVPASARSASAVPEPGSWCGMTEDGGSIRVSVTGDSRWVSEIAIVTPSCSVSVSEVARVRRAQIRGAKFVFRTTVSQPSDNRRVRLQPGSGGRCRMAPCRPTSARRGGGGSSNSGGKLMVRGTFDARDSLSGAYSIPGSLCAAGSRGANGRYVAWPAWMGCP